MKILALSGLFFLVLFEEASLSMLNAGFQQRLFHHCCTRLPCLLRKVVALFW